MKLHKILCFAFLAAAHAYLFASPSFTGAIGGSAGGDVSVPLNGGSSDWSLPLAGFAAAQANLAEWAIFRGEVAAAAQNFDFNDIFSESDATVRLNELSFVLKRRAFTATNYFSAFLGTYEQIGSDAFLMRHFGVEPISSQIERSYTSLSGTPIRSSKGAGVSYIINFDKAPIATGGYFYFSKNKKGDWALNLDARFALESNLATLDFLFGIGSPFQNSYNDEDVVLVIDTITIHGGINLLAGNKYSHGILIQVGLEDVVVRGSGAGTLDGDEIKFLLEPRINFGSFRFSLSLYSFDEKSVKELLYLNDPFGAGFTFYKDDIEGKKGDVTLGIHAFASVSGVTFFDFAQGKNTGGARYNAYITPYAVVPVSETASLEAMAQAGVTDISGSPALAFKFAVAAKKTF